MNYREHFIRRRVARWKAAIARWWEGRASPKPLTEASIREAVDAFRRRSVAERMTMPGAEYGDLSEQAFLLSLLDEERRRCDHATTVSMRTIDSDPQPQTWIYPYIDPPPPPERQP